MLKLLTVLLLMIVLASNVQGQSLHDINPGTETSLRTLMPNAHGVSHHFINENKINLMKDANRAMELIEDYKFNITIGYIETSLGLGTLIFVGCFMDVPQWWSDGRNDSRARKRENIRYGIAALGAAVSIDGIVRIITNHRKLDKIRITLQPTSGGITFFF